MEQLSRHILNRRPRSLTTVSTARPTCYICMRPNTHCVCDLVAPFEAHCHLLILQHPHERRKFHATTKLLLRAVTNAELLRSVLFEESGLSERLRGRSPYLLYPGPDAVPCESAELHENATVIAIDGTWHEAKKILYRNPFLKKLPTLSFSTALRSRYRIRKQPEPHCLSTLESIAYLLKFNAAAQGQYEMAEKYEGLLQGFDQMIERQLDYARQVSNLALRIE